VDYGVLRPGGLAERAVFIVDRAGIVRYIDIHDIAEPPPAGPILAALDALGG
jgi:alkyl hydroperoxide reductase subunit AhpC